jgi:proteic killer suppression protein
MEVTFEKYHLREIYDAGKTTDKKYRFQPAVIRKYIRVIDLMIDQPNMTALANTIRCITKS